VQREREEREEVVRFFFLSQRGAALVWAAPILDCVWSLEMSPKKVLDPGTDSTLYNPFAQNDARDQGSWRIGALARVCGVSRDTLRHYERKGVLSAGRSANGYRHYAANALGRVQLVRTALAIGFTLDELGPVLKLRDRGGVPCQRVRQLAAEKLSAVESQLADLMLLRDRLRSSLQDWDDRLAQTDPSVPARLLEALASSNTSPSRKSFRLPSGRRNSTGIGAKDEEEKLVDIDSGRNRSRDGIARLRAATTIEQSTTVKTRFHGNERARRHRDGVRSR